MPDKGGGGQLMSCKKEGFFMAFFCSGSDQPGAAPDNHGELLLPGRRGGALPPRDPLDPPP